MKTNTNITYKEFKETNIFKSAVIIEFVNSNGTTLNDIYDKDLDDMIVVDYHYDSGWMEIVLRENNEKIVRVEIIDNDESCSNKILNVYYLVNPNPEKLEELKIKIEKRLNYQYDQTLTDKEIEESEKFIDNIWDNIDDFIKTNFKTIEINNYIINY